jgi:hypothetical protein
MGTRETLLGILRERGSFTDTNGVSPIFYTLSDEQGFSILSMRSPATIILNPDLWGSIKVTDILGRKDVKAMREILK